MNEKQSRREFLVKPVQWAAAAGLLSGMASSMQARSRRPPDAAKILTRTLGRTGLSLPIVSMGVMNAEVPGLVRRAYEAGMRHFDTAESYQRGRNEEMVGAVIKDMGVRDRVVISTKVWLRGKSRDPQARNVFRRTFEGSLRRLQMDHVDILYYHSVDSADEVGAEGPLQALAELKKEGKTRFTGLSTHQGAVVLPAAARAGAFDVGLVTINFTMASDKNLLGAIDQAVQSGMGIVAMKTQAGGLSQPEPALPKTLPPHSQTALLKWVLHNPSITTAIPGFTTYEQLDQNFSVASDLEYTNAEKEFLGDKTFLARAQFCQQCGRCLGDCPRGVDIPALMRSHMYAVQYSNRELAGVTLGDLEPGRGLDACRSCGTCPATCRNYVNIGAKISHLIASGLEIAV
jgi:aryl-alcohol dehydrogenase-like predicted oxidoreductase